MSSIFLSLKTASTATVITFFLGIITARWMWQYQGKGKVIIELFLTAPLVLPPTVIGFLLLFLFGKNTFIGQLLDLLGISLVFSWYATVIAAIVVSFPLMYKSAYAAFSSVDRDLIACARTLGASEKRIFWEIVLPLAQSGLISGTFLSFARALGEFGATLMLAGSIPGKTQTIPIAIYLATESGEINRAIILVLVMLGISLTGIFLINYFSTKTNKIFSIGRKTFQRSLYPKVLPKKIELLVDIHHQLPDFCLNVYFKANRIPLGILGSSGAGKSTILKCIAGLSTPDYGKIILNGKVLFDSQKKINLPPYKRNVGFLFQNYALFPHLTVAENIAFGIKISSANPSAIEQEITKQLIAVNLLDFRNRYPRELSGGEQQRVALARVKASNPEILLLDEPFSALDTYLKAKLIKILQKNLDLDRRISLFVSHNLSEAYQICPRLAIMDRGKFLVSQPRQNILKNPAKLKIARLIGCVNFSRIKIFKKNSISAIDWNCFFRVYNIHSDLTHIGIHSSDIVLFPQGDRNNTFDCWLANVDEYPYSKILYLKLHRSSKNKDDYHLQANVTKKQWLDLQQYSFPWKIQLSNFFLLRE